jgi:hypothetical protein
VIVATWARRFKRDRRRCCYANKRNGCNRERSRPQAQIRSQQQAEMQRREEAAQEAAKQQRQAETQRAPASIPSVSQEGIREHTYEILQDHIILVSGLRVRLRRGEQYHGRILVDHAEIDINGISYNVPSGILSAPKD